MSDQFIGQVLADKYRIEEVLREGAFGKIYRGKHLLMEKPVTVKLLSPALTVDENIVRQFSQEARTVSNISHPNILNVNDFGTDKSGAVYIILEGVEGDTLEKALLVERNFAVERAVRIARQIAAALSVAHSNGIIHKNLNPENVLLSGTSGNRETVKVLDFGSFDTNESHSLEEAAGSKNLEYRAPEQDSQLSEADTRSDIYALGVIFYKMLAGDVPFIAENPTELMLKKSEELPPPLSAFRNDLPENVEPVILKALSINPDARQQTAAGFIEELNRATDFSNELETVIATAPQTQVAESNNLWKTAFIVLAGISLLSVSLIYATYTKQTDPTTALQYDANGQPVQPINPATGLPEMGASNMIPYGDANSLGNGNLTAPETLTYPDGVDPWGRGGIPPGGSIPYPVNPGGELYTIPGNSGSVFMPQSDGSGGIILIPVPANTNTNTDVQTKTPKTTPANTTASPTPAPTQAAPETTTTPAVKPAQPKTSEPPKEKPPASTEKVGQSGKLKDAN
ncbi:MAG: serine/threonine protein kinase [Pyrinomonadaceae bacterium]